jgi:hypothetical protein
LKHLALLIGVVLWGEAFPQELVTLPTRPGVTQSFFIANMGARKAEAAALMLIGGGGNINLRVEGGQVRFGQGNFLPRSRREFIRNGVLPVILDNPSDQQAGSGMSDQFRESAAHATDVRAVVAEVKRRYPGLPVFVVGTSRSTISAAHLAVALDGEIAGVVLSASFLPFDGSKVRMPVLLVHHVDDGCRHTPYREAARLEKRYALVSVHGGKPPESGPCEPFSAHGFLGKEPQTVDAIAAWMLGKPFAKEIE